MTFLELPLIEVFLRVLVALLLGIALGIERVYAHKTAGMRTYGLVAMGAALFVVISEVVLVQYGSTGADVNPLFMAAPIVTGIGFLGAGLIIFKDNHIENLTTAAALWVSAGIGVAAGFGLYWEALIATLLALFVLHILAWIEKKMKIRMQEKEKELTYKDQESSHSLGA